MVGALFGFVSCAAHHKQQSILWRSPTVPSSPQRFHVSKCTKSCRVPTLGYRSRHGVIFSGSVQGRKLSRLVASTCRVRSGQAVSQVYRSDATADASSSEPKQTDVTRNADRDSQEAHLQLRRHKKRFPYHMVDNSLKAPAKVRKSTERSPATAQSRAAIEYLGGLVCLLGILMVLLPATGVGTLMPAGAAESVAGSAFEAIVCAYILLQGANQLSEGSELLLEVVDQGVIGGLILPILGTLPDALIIAVSGLAVSPDRVQEQIEVGIGTLAGSTTLLLTVAWGSSVLLGRCDLSSEGTAVSQTLTRKWDFINTGVTVEADVGKGAAIMMATMFLYGIVQVPFLAGDVGDNLPAAVGGVVCLMTLAACCIYQIVYPAVQKRRITAARYKRWRREALQVIAAESAAYGSLIGTDGLVDHHVLGRVFDSLEDSGGAGYIGGGRLRSLLQELPMRELPGGGLKTVLSPQHWLRELDVNADSRVCRDDFHRTLERWVEEERDVLRQGEPPGVGKVLRRLDNLGRQTLGTVDVWPEDGAGRHSLEPLEERRIAIEAALRMAAGMLVCAAFSDPLVDSLASFSKASGLPPFFVAFVLTPLASNAAEMVSALRFAATKRRRNVSLTFSQLYGGATMNNTLCLGVFLLIIYHQHLDWVYSSEVLVIAVSTLLVGWLGLSRRTVRAWWALPVIGIYPLSLFAVWYLDVYWGWQ